MGSKGHILSGGCTRLLCPWKGHSTKSALQSRIRPWYGPVPAAKTEHTQEINPSAATCIDPSRFNKPAPLLYVADDAPVGTWEATSAINTAPASVSWEWLLIHGQGLCLPGLLFSSSKVLLNWISYFTERFANTDLLKEPSSPSCA